LWTTLTRTAPLTLLVETIHGQVKRNNAGAKLLLSNSQLNALKTEVPAYAMVTSSTWLRSRPTPTRLCLISTLVLPPGPLIQQTTPETSLAQLNRSKAQTLSLERRSSASATSIKLRSMRILCNG
jgi:hypothetical protein